MLYLSRLTYFKGFTAKEYYMIFVSVLKIAMLFGHDRYAYQVSGEKLNT